MNGQSGHVPALDGVRGVAIALVFLYHLDGTIRVIFPGTPCHVPGFAFLQLVVSGHTGVTLFFILSAYLLTPPFLVEMRGGTRVDRMAWFTRRARRILPLYWVAVVPATVLVEPHRVGVWLAWPAFRFADLWLAEPLAPSVIVWWALSTEVQFYLALPLVAVLLRPGRWRPVGVVLLVAWAALYVAFAWEAWPH